MDWGDDTFEELNGDLSGHQEDNFDGNLADFRSSQLGRFSPSGSSEDHIAQDEPSELLSAKQNSTVKDVSTLDAENLTGSDGSSSPQQEERWSSQNLLDHRKSVSRSLDLQENGNTDSSEVGMELREEEAQVDPEPTASGMAVEKPLSNETDEPAGGAEEGHSVEEAVDATHSPRSSSRNSEHVRFDELISEEDEKEERLEETISHVVAPKTDGQTFSPNRSRKSYDSRSYHISTEREVQIVLNGMVDQIAGRQSPGIDSENLSTLSDGSQMVIALAMEDLDVEIKQEAETLTWDRQPRAASKESFVSTEMVSNHRSAFGSIPSTSRSPPVDEEENLLRSIGLRSRGVEKNREVSEEIEAPPINPNVAAVGSSRGRLAKKTGPHTLTKGSAMRKKSAPGTSNARYSTALKRVCVVSNCEHYMKSPPNVYPFPNEKTKPSIRRKWVDAINDAKGATKKLLLGNLNKNAHYGVCLRHFNRQTDFKPGEKLLLLENAIPSFKGISVSKKLNSEASAAGTTAGGTKAQFARKTIVPVLKIASSARVKSIPEEIEGEDISESGQDIQEDDSDRNATWEKTKEAKEKQARRSTRKRQNPDSTSESDHEEHHTLTGKASTQNNKSMTANTVAGRSKVSVVKAKSRVLQPMLGRPSKKVPSNGVQKAVAPPTLIFPNVSNSLAAAVLAGQAAGKAPVVGKDATGATLVMKKPIGGSTSRPAPMPCVAVTGTNGKDVRLVLQKMTCLPTQPIILPPQIIMKSPPKVLMASKMAQVEEDDLEPDSSDDEIQDILKEAQDEILELKFELEDARLDVASEKRKVEHLETRVSAWIRAYFCSSTLEAERLEMMDKLASYYLEQAKKVDEERKSLKTELELFRANYVRSQKETESYRQQIIELQSSSSREIERIQTAKTKNEKDAQDTISILRRQLAEAVMATEHARRGQKASHEDVRKLQQAASSAVGRGAQMAYVQPVTPTSPGQPAPRTRGRQKTTPQYDVISPAGSSASQQYFSSPPSESSTSKKRARKTKDAPLTESASKKARESSVDRASLSGSGQSASWTSAQQNMTEPSVFPSGLGYYLQPQQHLAIIQPAHVQQDTRRSHETNSNFNLDQYSQHRSTDRSTFMATQLTGPEFFQSQQSSVIASGFSPFTAAAQQNDDVVVHHGMIENAASRTRSQNQLESVIESAEMTPPLQSTQPSFHHTFQNRNY